MELGEGDSGARESVDMGENNSDNMNEVDRQMPKMNLAHNSDQVEKWEEERASAEQGTKGPSA